jgi:hypothetical protein
MESLEDTHCPAARPARGTREAGAEPIPGYRLLAPLGSGGFGEVWKCEVPGGLVKAIKLVNGNLNAINADGSVAKQELEAFHRIKAIRHPFLLSIERVEVIAGELLIVMELADRNLHELLTECQAGGEPGVPRPRLLGLLREAAEALDVMSREHGLQHLDVKPQNLFLVSNHLKVADFGLVYHLGDTGAGAARRTGGVTPVYAAPEIFQGQVSRQSDQYSLAVVYQELLTGVRPFRGKSGRQLMLQHLNEAPDLDPLPPADRPVLAKALAKDPGQRFPSCTDFVQALLEANSQPGADPRRLALPGALAAAARQLRRSGREPQPGSAARLRRPPGGRAGRAAVPASPAAPDATGREAEARPAAGPRPAHEAETPAGDPARREDEGLPPVIPCAVLAGEAVPDGLEVPSAGQLAEELIRAEVGPVRTHEHGSLRYLEYPGGVLEYRCAVPMIPALLRLKLKGFSQEWRLDGRENAEGAFTFRIKKPQGFWQRCLGREAGLDLQITLQPPIQPDDKLAVVSARIQPFGGGPPPGLVETGALMFESLRAYLQPQPEGRGPVRFPFRHPLEVYPVFPGGELGEPLEATGQDLSAGGIGFRAPGRPPSDTVYVRPAPAARPCPFALLAQVVWAEALPGGGCAVGARFPDEGPEGSPPAAAS